ncbi:MAG: succinylglutamate desuccinylase/aspartoacylase family protein [Vicingaceae bacterium]
MENSEAIYQPVLKRSFPLSRKIGVIGNGRGPTLVFFGGIHGNEQLGYAALVDVFSELKGRSEDFNGRAYAFSGNMGALRQGKRYLETDLNRLWSDKQIARIEGKQLNGNASLEEKEQVELFQEIKTVIRQENGPFMFFDLHTTSSSSVPFVLINDTMNNRQLAESYPLRIILGIEEYLSGPLLSYINDQGFISLGFEAGQHDSLSSFELHKMFVLQSFLITGLMKDAVLYSELILDNKHSHFAHSFFEVRHCYRVEDDEDFKMEPGYVNFSPVKKDQTVARNKHGVIQVKESGFLFMPLYQTKGNEGFYLIKLIPTFWLRFSFFIRKFNFERILMALPGIEKHDDVFKSIKVNERVAKYLSRELFHLLGYRRTVQSGTKRIYIKREFTKQQLSLFSRELRSLKPDSPFTHQ